MKDKKVCPINNCINFLNKRSICDMHRARFRRNGHYDLLHPKLELPHGYLKHCQLHGFLQKEQIRKSGKTILCKVCTNKKNKDTKFIELDKDAIERKCGRCKLTKSLSEFSPYNLKLRWPSCKKCALDSQSRQYAKHKHHYKRWYNLSVEQYNEILNIQNNRCAICKRTSAESQPGKNNKRENNLAVDHCHKLEVKGIIAIRGLLCFTCNSILGKFKDDINLFERAIEYLKKEPVLITKKPQ